MEKTLSAGRGAIQEAQYRFPYHYLPRIENGRFAFHEVLSWGHEYLSYLTHVADLLAEREWSSALDVGCGDGRLVDTLSRRFPDRKVVGLDYSDRAVSLARVLAPHGEFVAGDVTNPDLLGAQFDIMTCVETIEHIEPAFLPDFVAGMRQHLRTDAPLIVTVPSTNAEVSEKHYQHFDPKSLSAALEPSFSVERVYYVNADSGLLRLLRMAISNRFYTITHPTPLTAFYNHYLRNYFRSDARHGRRVVAICRAA